MATKELLDTYSLKSVKLPLNLIMYNNLLSLGGGSELKCSLLKTSFDSMILG